MPGFDKHVARVAAAMAAGGTEVSALRGALRGAVGGAQADVATFLINGAPRCKSSQALLHSDHLLFEVVVHVIV